MVLQAGYLVFGTSIDTGPLKTQTIKEIRSMQLCIVGVIRDSWMRWSFLIFFPSGECCAGIFKLIMGARN
jgi:hypothetical protein